jgi:hypothetical protein
MLTVVPDPAAGDDRPSAGSSSLIDELVLEGAHRMLAEALQAEVDAYIARFAGERDKRGHRQRQACRPRYRRAASVLFGDPAAVGA